jgi:hypothetical protein
MRGRVGTEVKGQGSEVVGMAMWHPRGPGLSLHSTLFFLYLAAFWHLHFVFISRKILRAA